jgi:hypothetical protein
MRGGLVRLEEDVKGFTLEGLNEGDISRFYFFCLAFDQMMKEGVKGDIAELGVYRGNTATLIAAMARRMGSTAYLLDTFEGFIEGDLVGIDAQHRAQFADTSLNTVQNLIGEDHVRYIKGHFPESALQVPDETVFCLVHIDCDLYSPIRSALQYFYPRLLPGGYLIVHDYASLCWDGAERAVDEFFADKPEAVLPLTDGGGSVAIRRCRPANVRLNWLVQKKLRLFHRDWTSAGGGGLIELLAGGWSGSEPDRVWGIGAVHVLEIVMDEIPEKEVRVDAEVEAALLSARPSQTVDVFASARHLATWKFSLLDNRAIRTVTVPANCISMGDIGHPVLQLEFKPQSVIALDKLDPHSKDDRAHGLALFRIRRGS